MKFGNVIPSVGELRVEFAGALPVARKRPELRDDDCPSFIYQRPCNVLKPAEVVEAIE
jgi:hypothetical protein